MMKKHLFYFAAITAAVAVILLGCDVEENDDSVNFIIDNQSIYDLENVQLSGKAFTAANSSFLPKGAASKGVPLPPETGRTITFTRKDSGVGCSIENVSISIREDRYTIRDETPVKLSDGRKVELGKVLASPSGVAAVAASSTSVTINWNAVPGAQEYYIYRSSTADGAYEKLTPNGVAGTSYTDSDLPSGASYYYKVAAKNADYESGQSNAVSAVTIPGAPSGVSASAASSASVIISWDAATGAEEYYIYRSSTADGAYAKLATTPAVVIGTSYTDTGLSPSAVYYYKVAAKNSAGTGEQSASVSATTLLAPPSGVSASAASPTSVTISWDAVTGAEEYYIYRSPTAEGAYAKLTTTPAAVTETSYTDTGLSSGATYYYKVAAYKSGGIGEQSSFASTPTIPGVPSSVSAVAASSTSITVSWDAVTGAEEYYIYRSSTAEGAYAKLTTTPSVVTGTSYTDTGLSSSTAYYYKVAAKNSGGTGEQSSSVSAATLLAHPSGVGASAASSTSITVSWEAVTGAQEYYIYRSSTANGAYAKLTTTPSVVTGTSYTDTGLSSGTAYYYKVAAYNGGTSEQSSAVSATTLLAPPSGVSAEFASTTSITVSWGSVTSAEEYYIYRSSTAEGAYAKLTTTPAAVTGTSYTDTGLSSGATYYYKVAAKSADGESEMSSFASATLLATPSGVSASAVSTTSVAISWSVVTGATSYSIYRSSTTADGDYAMLTTTAIITGTSYTDTGLSSGATYYYKVAAKNSGGVSGQSSAVSAITIPGAPSSVSASAASSTSITVSWDAVTGAEEYYIYRSSTANGAYFKLTTTPAAILGTSYTNTGLSSGATYYYKVAAKNSSGVGEQSVAVTVSSAPPSVGSSLSLNAWTDGAISGSGLAQYYYFYAASGSQYTIKWNDFDQGDGTKTCDVKVSAYWYSDNASIFGATDHGYASGRVFTASRSGYVILKVEPYSSYSSGTFAIGCY